MSIDPGRFTHKTGEAPGAPQAMARAAVAGDAPYFGVRPLKRVLQCGPADPAALGFLEGRFSSAVLVVLDASLDGRLTFEDAEFVG